MINRLLPALKRQSDVARTKRGALAAAFAVAILALGACDPRGSASVEQLLKRAQEHRSAGNIRASVIELKNALQKEPQNPNARLLLGQAFVDLGDSAAAEIELRRAQELGADADRAALLLAETRILQARFDQVLRDLPVNENASPATKAAMLGLRGRAHLGLGQRVAAEEAFKAALELDEKAVDARLGLARIAFATGDQAKGREHIALAAQFSPDDVKVLAFQGDIAFANGDYDAAEEFYRQILKSRKDDIVALNAQLGISRAQIAAGKLKDATARLTQLLKIAPNDPATNYLRALAAYQSKEYQLAKTHAELALRAARSHRPSLFIAGASNYALGQYEQAFRHLTAFVTDVPNSVEGRKLLAATQMKMGQAQKAVGTLQQAAKQGGEDAQLLAMIGAATAQAGDFRSAARYFERAVAKEPDNATLRTQLGATQLATGNVAGGIEELEKAAQQDPEGRADVALIVAHLRSNEFAKALEAAKKLQEKRPTDSSGYTLAGMAEIGNKNVAGAKAAFAKALEVKPGDRNAIKNLAALAINENAFDEARKYYQDALNRAPNDEEFLVHMAQLEARAGRPREGLAYLEKAVSANPDSAFARVTLARVYLLAGEPNKALAAAQPVLQKDGREPAALEVVGRSQMALGQNDLAIATFRDLTGARPESPEAHQYLATAYENAGMVDRAISQAEIGLRFGKDSPPLKFQYARLLAKGGKLDRATQMLAELKQANPNSVEVADLEGSVALANNRAKDAVAAYTRLFELQENNFNVIKLARAKTMAGQPTEALSDLETWMQKYPDDALTRTALADTYLSRGQPDKAAAEYAQVLRVTPDSTMALNNLAWSLSKAGRTADAVPHAQRAAELAPDNPAVLDTLGVVLVAADRAKDAVRPLRTAAEQAPTDPSIQFHLAQALAKDNQVAEARDILRLILGGQNAWPERAEAEALLKRIGG